MIHLKNISLKFAENQIFDDFNLSVPKNQKLIITGPSGRGKSTLLKLISGIQPADSGQVFIDNKVLDTHSISNLREQIIWIPQNINLPINNGTELMSLMNVAQNKEKVKTHLQQLLLNPDILNKDFSEISGGEKQRIIIAICLSLKGEIILMDEPSSSLDLTSKKALLSLVNSISNKTLISVSHDDYWIANFDNTIAL